MSMSTKKMKIGLFGFGVVGQGFHEILTSQDDLTFELTRICVKQKDKKRPMPLENFTWDKNDILNDPDVDLVVELIDNADDAYEIVTQALIKGKNVVTANKKMVAEHLNELVRLQKEQNVSLLYDASSCGSIPIIKTLENHYGHQELDSVSGVFNGSTNYILSKVLNDNLDYDISLKQAQDLGFVETDPSLDLLGFDALNKLCITTAHAYGVFVKPQDVLNHGIEYLSSYDVRFAKEKGYKIKQIAQVMKTADDKITLFVIPMFIKEDDLLYNVDYEYNAAIVDAHFGGKQFYQGKGAGGHPTGSAVYADVSAVYYNERYEYKKYLQKKDFSYTTDVEMEVYLRYYEEKNLNLFNFKKITDKHYGKDFNYVIGTVNLADLIKVKDKLNATDICLVSTGKIK